MASKPRTPGSVEGIDIQQALDSIRAQLDQDDAMSPALRASIEMLILVVTLLTYRFNRNSRNSSKPPASDPNRAKSPRRMGALGLLVLLVFWRQAFASNRNDPLLVRKSLLPNLGLLIASVLIFGGAGYVFYTKVLRPETPQYFQSDAYMISFLTRDGKRLSSREGKLALAR